MRFQLPFEGAGLFRGEQFRIVVDAGLKAGRLQRRGRSNRIDRSERRDHLK